MTSRPSSRNPWPVGIVITFALFIAATAGLIGLALVNRHELTRPDYYEQELRHGRQMESAARARELGAAASLAFDTARHRLTVVLPPDHARRGATGYVRLSRPAAAALDREWSLALGPGGLQTLDVPELQPGLWKVRVAWTVAGQEFLLEENLTNLAAAGPDVTPH